MSTVTPQYSTRVSKVSDQPSCHRAIVPYFFFCIYILVILAPLLALFQPALLILILFYKVYIPLMSSGISHHPIMHLGHQASDPGHPGHPRNPQATLATRRQTLATQAWPPGLRPRHQPPAFSFVLNFSKSDYAYLG